MSTGKISFTLNVSSDVSFVPVQATSGCVRVQDVLSAVTPATIMVSIMLANNETGVVQVCFSIK